MREKIPGGTCANHPVAASEVGSVSLCPDCGVVHLSLQYVSMRFEPEAFRALVRMLGLAQNRLDRLSCSSQMSPEQSDTLEGFGGMASKAH